MELYPLACGSFTNWLRLLIGNGGVDPAYFPKALSISCISLTGSLGRVIERLAYDSRLAKITLDKPPIFVIGHWRSGTTFLHNLNQSRLQLGLCLLPSGLSARALYGQWLYY